MQNATVVDARDHIVGRLASIIAKEALKGNKVVVVRAEEMVFSGNWQRNLGEWRQFINKRCAYNPKRGPFHHRAPSAMFERIVRGMVPHRTPRGSAALARIQVFDGIPPQFQRTKRMVIPEALKINSLGKYTETTTLGLLAVKAGWKYAEIISQLEDKRKARSHEFHVKKMEQAKAYTAAAQTVSSIDAKLAEYGY
ncbi:Ribosomal protein L13 [Carpediemonas membranifera]|uniref:Ribosomal protein L13 n=1 Tax=Carpediemonas membranifera TaxID=201153 RepID=A0A8J6B518_9EUKA|nr:Ribosomal protein L13 [Carpediemonas membranifera]|eukprot:KAG9393164.1 Ribosomal protein L13 [Carpediemonas membranifera]